MSKIAEKDFIAFSKQVHQLINYCHSITENIPSKIVTELSDMELAVISMLSDNSKIKICDIASTQHISKSTLTGIIRRLEKNGYLLRKINDSDLRSFELILTDKGKEAQKQHLEFERNFFTKLIEPLSESENAELIKILNKIMGVSNNE